MATQEEMEKARLQQVEKPAQAGQYTNLEGISDASRNNLNYYGQGYQQSQSVADAKNYLQSVIDRKPGSFASQYGTQIADLYNRIMNRPKFAYDVNKDPLFQQYKHQYMVNGQRAMQDTIGNSAALTGGYGNSWGTTAGYQAYQAHLQQLNNKVPELEARAYDRYSQEGDSLRNNLALTMNLDDTDYGRYRDTVGDWQADRSDARGAYDAEYARDYANWANMLKYYQDLAAMENENYWNRQNYDFQLRQYEDALKAAEAAAAASRGGGSSKSSGKTLYNTGSVPYSNEYYVAKAIGEMQKNGGGQPSSDLLAAAGITQADWNKVQALPTVEKANAQLAKTNPLNASRTLALDAIAQKYQGQTQQAQQTKANGQLASKFYDPKSSNYKLMMQLLQ